MLNDMAAAVQLLQCLLDPLQSCHFSLRMVGVGDNLDGYRLPSFWPAKLRAARRAPAHPPLTTARSQASLGPGLTVLKHETCE